MKKLINNTTTLLTERKCEIFSVNAQSLDYKILHTTVSSE